MNETIGESAARGELRVLGLLENQWFKNPPRMKRILEQQYKGDRAEFVRTFLFWSCKTGKVLELALGERWCERITWEETSAEMGSRPGEKFPPDIAHVAGVIERHRPHVVIAFGVTANIAINGCRAVGGLDSVGGPAIVAPHPAARDQSVPERLRLVRQWLDRLDASWLAGEKFPEKPEAGTSPRARAQKGLFD